MWLTGFDVKPLSVMYFDKPMKAHGLMQAIARANRVAEGKSNGLIVDYVGVVKALRQALADYTRDLGDDRDPVDVVVGKDELIRRIGELTGQITSFMSDRGFELETLLAADGFGKLEAIQDAADAMFPPGASSDMQEALAAHFVRRGLLASCGVRREGWCAAF